MTSKFALVTGASTGIGRAVAVELGKNGWEVGLIARRERELKRTKDLVEKVGGKARCMIADLTSSQDIAKLISSVSKLDLMVNIAGIWHGVDEVYAGKDIGDFDKEVIRDTYLVGVVAPTLLVSGLVNLMPRESAIINISGTFENGAKGWIPYYVSKRALEDLTVGLSEELGDKGIRVMCVSPSDTATEEYKKFFPEDVMDANSPEDVAKLVVDLYSSGKNSEFVVIKKGQRIEDGYHK